MTDPWIENGWFVQRLWTGKGMVVIRPAYVAFLPTEEIKHLGAQIAKGVALAAAGLVEAGGRKPVPVGQWLDEIRQTRPEAFDERVEALLEPTGGMKWSPSSARVKIRNIPLRFKKGLWFVNGEQSMRLSRAVGKEELAHVRAFLADWTWM